MPLGGRPGLVWRWALPAVERYSQQPRPQMGRSHRHGQVCFSSRPTLPMAPLTDTGKLITCEHGGRRVTRTEYDGTLTVLMDTWQGHRLNSPNDVVVKSDGSIWFTDPIFGILGYYEGYKATPEVGQHIYRLDGETGEASVVADDVLGPNGLCFAPDESLLYVVESRCPASQDPGVRCDGKRPRTAQQTGRDRRRAGGTPDGMRCDIDG